MCLRTSPSSSARSTPQTFASPESAGIRPERIRRVVLFPAPLGPRNPTISPLPMEKLIPLRA